MDNNYWSLILVGGKTEGKKNEKERKQYTFNL